MEQINSKKQKPEEIAFILGTVQLGLPYGIQNAEKSMAKPNVKDGVGLLEKALRLGIEYIDTANEYGSSQRVIGQFSAKREFQILSKFQLGQKNLKDCISTTLGELGLDRVHCYSFHRVSEITTPNLNALENLKAQRVVGLSGASVYSNADLKFVLEETDIEVIQVPFNLLDNWSLKSDLLEQAKKKKRILHARSLFLQGLLLMEATQRPSKFKALEPQLQKVAELAGRFGIDLPILCLAYAMSKKVFDGLVIGVDNESQLAINWENFRKAQRIQMDLSEIDAVLVEDPRFIDPSQWNQLL